MAYSGIDQRRFEYLLSLGTSDFELKQFFKDCRFQLINQGARVQNLPHGFKERVRVLALKLPLSTDKVVQSWFMKHLTMADPADVEEVIQEFNIYEECDEEPSEDSARRLARSCLVHLFSDNPPQALLNFLNNPIGVRQEVQVDTAEHIDDMPDLTAIRAYPEKLPQVLINLIEGRDADQHLAGFPPELATFITALQHAGQGNTKEAREISEMLPVGSMLRSNLEQFVKQQEVRQASNEMPSRGLQIIEPEAFEGAFDYDSDEVLAYCTKADKPTAVFVRPLAAIVGGKLRLLSDKDRQSLFPQSGSIIAFSEHGHPRQPRRGEVGIWKVAEHVTDKATHFHLASEKRTVHEMRFVPFPSTEYDSVREYLKDYAERSGNDLLQSPLFELEDGLVVGSRSDHPDLSKDEAYGLGLSSWRDLQAIRLEGRLFVLGPLPAKQGLYECVSLSSAVRNLFKNRKLLGEFTKGQLSELVRYLVSQESQANALRIQRIKSQIESIEVQKEAFNALVTELMNIPIVMQRIDQLVNQEALKQLDNKNNMKADIARLQKERREWEERVRKQHEEYRKLPAAVSKAVKTRFEKARADGLGTLAEIALFQTLSSSAQITSSASENPADRKGRLVEPIMRELPTNGCEAVSILKSFGVSPKQATSFRLVSETAFKSGLMVCVRGVAARPAVEGWARTLSNNGILIDSTIGLIDDSTVRDVLARVPTPEVLTLLDANLSALDIYAKSLSDLVLMRTADTTVKQQPVIFLALTDGVGALPLPRTFEQISVLIDLDAHYVFRNATEIDDLMSSMFYDDDGALYKRMWRPAADRLRMKISELDTDDQALVLSVLAAQ